MSDEKKIFIDDDWKSQVAAEKEALKQEAITAQQAAVGTPPAGGTPPSGTPAADVPADVASPGDAPAGGQSSAGQPSDGQPSAGHPAAGHPAAGQPTADPPTQMPPASLEMLVTTLATEAMVALGQFPNPATQEVSLSIEHASYAIDMLAMLEEKTKGNLTPAEATMMTDLLHQLRMMFIAAQQSPPSA